RINAAFFTMNGIISLTFFACILAARVGGFLNGDVAAPIGFLTVEK
ncbi:MAG: hypothetical protein H7Z40_17635, partial [Phycisphaerae bacterium]|nr:hypothetical protein [Gemmatimonadaceae bacterium]